MSETVKESVSGLTIEQFVYASDRQVGILCGYSKGNGHHLVYSNPGISKYQALAKWFGGDLAKAANAIAKRQARYQHRKSLSRYDQQVLEQEQREMRRQIRAEIDAIIAARSDLADKGLSA